MQAFHNIMAVAGVIHVYCDYFLLLSNYSPCFGTNFLVICVMYNYSQFL